MLDDADTDNTRKESERLWRSNCKCVRLTSKAHANDGWLSTLDLAQAHTHNRTHTQSNNSVSAPPDLELNRHVCVYMCEWVWCVNLVDLLLLLVHKTKLELILHAPRSMQTQLFVFHCTFIGFLLSFFTSCFSFTLMLLVLSWEKTRQKAKQWVTCDVCYWFFQLLFLFLFCLAKPIKLHLSLFKQRALTQKLGAMHFLLFCVCFFACPRTNKCASGIECIASIVL